MTFEELDLNKIYSYADYLKWNFEVGGIPQRLELIKGKIFKMPPAHARRHQETHPQITPSSHLYQVCMSLHESLVSLL